MNIICFAFVFYRVDCYTSYPFCGFCVPDFDIEKCFLRNDVQSILKRITGFDLNKIFKERIIDDMGPPEYKLLTTKQLEEVNIRHTILQTHNYVLR